MEFNVIRFWSLLKREIILYKKYYLLTIFIFAIMSPLILGPFDTDLKYLMSDSSYKPGISVQYLLWFTMTMCSLMQYMYKNKSALTNEILLPSSTLEKYFCSFVRVYILLPILSFIGIITMFLILKYPLNPTFHYPVIQALNLGLLIRFLCFSLLYSLPIIAILHYFSHFKYWFLPLFILIGIIPFTNLWGYLDEVLGYTLYSSEVDNFMPYYGTKVFYIIVSMVSTLIFIFFQYLSYLRYYEREV